MSYMYKWLHQNYEARIAEKLRDAVDYDEMTEDEADILFDKLVKEWEDGYGDYMYDMIGDR